MTDLLCLNVPFIPYLSRSSRSPCVTRGGTLYYPMSLLTMTSYAAKKGYDARVMDLIAHYIPEWKEEVKKLAPKVVLVDTSTPSILNDVKIADELQSEMPDSKVILVGRHVTYAPRESLEFCKNVKIVARREFFVPIIEILEGKDYKSVKGLSYKEDGKIKHNPDAEIIKDVNEFGFLSKIIKDQLNVKDYYYSSTRNPYIMLQSAWGCPYNCAFCNEIVKNKYRHRSLENIIEEIKWVKVNLPEVKEILWDDPTFVVDEKFTQDLCNSMIDNKIKINWSTMTRANISLETLKVMKKAGAKTMHLGLESATQDSLDFVNKNMKFEDEVEYLKNCKKVGIMNHACFIIGLPNDTKETIKLTIERAKKLQAIDSIQCFPLIPTPVENILDKEAEGTIWDYLVKNNYLVTRDYSKWLKSNGSYNCVVNYPNLSNTEIEQFVEQFYKEFYYRPSFILYKIKQSITSFGELKRNLRSFMTFRSRSTQKNC
jgi:anaerobic magnesium-protoporphyrin IX monomethyl ester cyclase